MAGNTSDRASKLINYNRPDKQVPPSTPVEPTLQNFDTSSPLTDKPLLLVRDSSASVNNEGISKGISKQTYKAGKARLSSRLFRCSEDQKALRQHNSDGTVPAHSFQMQVPQDLQRQFEACAKQRALLSVEVSTSAEAQTSGNLVTSSAPSIEYDETLAKSFKKPVPTRLFKAKPALQEPFKTKIDLSDEEGSVGSASEHSWPLTQFEDDDAMVEEGNQVADLEQQKSGDSRETVHGSIPAELQPSQPSPVPSQSGSLVAMGANISEPQSAEEVSLPDPAMMDDRETLLLGPDTQKSPSVTSKAGANEIDLTGPNHFSNQSKDAGLATRLRSRSIISSIDSQSPDSQRAARLADVQLRSEETFAHQTAVQPTYAASRDIERPSKRARLSTTRLLSREPSHHPLPSSPPQPRHSARNNTTPRAQMASTNSHPLFDQFRQAYPHYDGQLDMFEYACFRLFTLISDKKAAHPTTWDDYVGRYVTDRSEWQAMGILYEDYYSDFVTKLKFSRGVIKEENVGLPAESRVQNWRRVISEKAERRRRISLRQESLLSRHSTSSEGMPMTPMDTPAGRPITIATVTCSPVPQPSNLYYEELQDEEHTRIEGAEVVQHKYDFSRSRQPYGPLLSNKRKRLAPIPDRQTFLLDNLLGNSRQQGPVPERRPLPIPPGFVSTQSGQE